MMFSVGLTILLMLTHQITLSASLKDCFCVPMEKNDLNNATEPLFSQSLKILKDCGEYARGTCRALCKTLATAAQYDPRSGQGFCIKLKRNVTNLYVSVYSKACNGDYEYTGLTFNKPICCQNELFIPCKIKNL